MGEEVEGARMREKRRRRLSLDSSLYPAGGRHLPPSPVMGSSSSRKSFAPFNSPFSPRMTPGERAKAFLDKMGAGQLLGIVNENSVTGPTGTKPKRKNRRASLDDLSMVLGQYTRSRQHVFDAIREIKKEEEEIDDKLENNMRRLSASDQQMHKMQDKVEHVRRQSFEPGSAAYETLTSLQDMAPKPEEEREGAEDETATEAPNELGDTKPEEEEEEDEKDQDEEGPVEALGTETTSHVDLDGEACPDQQEENAGDNSGNELVEYGGDEKGVEKEEMGEKETEASEPKEENVESVNAAAVEKAVDERTSSTSSVGKQQQVPLTTFAFDGAQSA